jgi:hypothetical protein
MVVLLFARLIGSHKVIISSTKSKGFVNNEANLKFGKSFAEICLTGKFVRDLVVIQFFPEHNELLRCMTGIFVLISG